MMEREWEETLERARAEGLPAGATLLPTDVILKMTSPWDKENTLRVIAQIDTDNTGT